MPTRKKYQTMIWVYGKRRSKLDRHKPKDRIKMYTLYKRIRVFRKAIVRIDKRRVVIDKLIVMTNRYFGLNIREKGSGDKISLARFCYYKYGIENGSIGTELSLAIAQHKYSGSKRRRDFSKSFQSKPKNKETYHNFKNYIEQK
jgi:hypothetical protein